MYFLDDMYTELTCKRIPYIEITYVYGKTLVNCDIVQVILRLEITKLSYIRSVML